MIAIVVDVAKQLATDDVTSLAQMTKDAGLRSREPRTTDLFDEFQTFLCSKTVRTFVHIDLDDDGLLTSLIEKVRVAPLRRIASFISNDTDSRIIFTQRRLKLVDAWYLIRLAEGAHVVRHSGRDG
jgi:hypothetical protein